MDFFSQQSRLKFRSGLLLLIFIAVLLLSLAVLYFCLTACIAVVSYSYALVEGTVSPVHKEIWSALIAHLPAEIYESPPDVFSWRPMLIVGGGLTLLVLFLSLVRTAWLYFRGGAHVAKKLGGTQIVEPTEFKARQLYHVVEEMALASGLPMPRVFILEREAGINAVTAGRSRNDAVIMITRGALDHLNRDELQAVVAHEFAHILNDDSSLNLEMAGFLFGLLAIFVVGRDMMKSTSSILKGAAEADVLIKPMLLLIPLVIVGLILMVGGWLGKVSAEIIQAAFSRQREYLADAFAVQFTRNPRALAGALKKVFSFSRRGMLDNSQALMMKSFFIVSPGRVQGLFGTHPPLKKRIRQIDPQWDGRALPLDFEDGREIRAGRVCRRLKPGDYFAARLDPEVWNSVSASLLATEKPWPERIGPGLSSASADSLALAQCLLDSIPESLSAAAASVVSAPALSAALFLHQEPGREDAEIASVQRNIIGDLMGGHVADEAFKLAGDLTADIRLPLLDLLIPSLLSLNREIGYKLNQTVQALARADSRLDFFEVAALHIIKKNLDFQEGIGRRFSALEGEIGPAAINLLSIMAYAGSGKQASAEKAFAAGLTHLQKSEEAVSASTRLKRKADHRRQGERQGGPLPLLAQLSGASIASAKVGNSHELARSFQILENAGRDFKKCLVAALAVTAGYDREIKLSEYELLRCAAAALDLPLPLLPAREGRK